MSKSIKIIFFSLLAVVIIIVSIPVIKPVVEFIDFMIIATRDDRAGKKNIIKYVQENRRELEDGIAEFIYEHPNIEGDISDSINIPNFNGIKDVTLYKTEYGYSWNEDRIDFYCGGYGIGSATGYEGFLYLLSGIEIETNPETGMADMHPLGFYSMGGGSDAHLFLPDGTGWRWNEKNGDNTVYVEHIDGEFYYYLREY